MGAVAPLLTALAEKSRRAGWGQAERARFFPPAAWGAASTGHQPASSLPELLLRSIFNRLRGQKISMKGKMLKILEVFNAGC